MGYMRNWFIAILLILIISFPVNAATIPSGGDATILKDEGSTQGTVTSLDCTGNNISCSSSGSAGTINVGSFITPAADYYVAGHNSPAEILNSDLASATWTASAKLGAYALTLDGTNDYVSVRHMVDIDPTAAFTIEAWIYPTSTTGVHSIVEKYDLVAGKGSYALRLNGSALEGIIVDGTDLTTNLCTGGTLSTDTWYWVAMTYDSATDDLKCYVSNATAVGTDTVTYNAVVSSVPMKIGGSGNAGATTFAGRIDEVAIWSIALSGSTTPTIAQRYNGDSGSALAGTETNLKAVWHMNDGTGSIALQSVDQIPSSSDSNNCTSTSTPCRTVQGAINKIPQFYDGSTTIHIASGVYPESPIINGYHPASLSFITIDGIIDPTVNNFSTCSGSPVYCTGTARISGTSGGSNTANFPKDTRSLFNLAASLSNTYNENLLEITSDGAGVGYVSATGFDYRNWYRIECPFSASNCQSSDTGLSMVTKWQDDVTPTVVEYKIYSDDDIPKIHGKSNRVASLTSSIGGYGLHIKNSEGIILRRIRISNNYLYGLWIDNSSIEEISAVTVDDGCYGLEVETSRIYKTVKSRFYNNLGDNRFIYESTLDTVYGNVFSTNGNAGLASYFSSSSNGTGVTGGISVNLAKNNTYSQFDFEQNFNTYKFQYNRADCYGKSNGLVISGNSQLNMTYPNTFTSTSGTCTSSTVRINNASSLRTNLQAGSSSDIEIKNGLYGLYVDQNSNCWDTSTVNDCYLWTYSGNTVNVFLPNDVGSISNSRHVNTIYEYDAFLSGTITSGSIGKLNWSMTQTNSSVTDQGTSRPGSIRLVTGATTNDNVKICWKSCTATEGLLDYANNFEGTFIINPTTTSTGVQYYAGFTITGSANTLYVYNAAGGSYWRFYSHTASGTTDTETSVAYSSGSWYKFKIKKVGSTAYLFYNDVLVDTRTTYVPTSGQGQPFFMAYATASGVKGMEVDYFDFLMSTYVR